MSAGRRTIDFGGLNITYDKEVLSPRLWTLAQAAWSAEILLSAPQGPVLEVCAGVGHIGLVAVAATDRDLVVVDLNPYACELARLNAVAAGMGERVEVREGRMDEVLEPHETFPLIIADPPWVASADIAAFPDDPAAAIDGGLDGLDLARTCCAVIDCNLADGGSALMQLGSLAQVEEIAAHLDEECSLRVREVREYERGVLAQLSR